MRFEVDGARVAQAAGAVQASAEQIGAEVDGMMRHLVELQGCWQGQAATQFQDVVTAGGPPRSGSAPPWRRSSRR